MSNFKTLFGIEPSSIQKTCVIVPYLAHGLLRSLGIEGLKKGKLYATANTDMFTFIKAGIGTLLVGDAVLYLEQTNCQEIIYFGACGLVQETDRLTIGSLVSPGKCMAFEGFTDVLLKQTDNITFHYPDKELFQSFLNTAPAQNIRPVTGMSIGSLKCEESYKEFLLEKGVEVVDMECSAFFSAAQYIRKKAIALLYVTDIIAKKSFFEPWEPEDKLRVDQAIQTACKAIQSFCGRPLTTENITNTEKRKKI
ncbi:MAG: hypothetical protein AYP45_16315 [Candidatus Brocadia carolinensis]|uniref:Nucleoside phosphorylase domain-containing protein n=1 Tax=Candidatus Brocadia carolinensis TaxID=1004156 RepID=A0A1V4APX1_9BACT|nr:MAG: hypothetical protein AYP45_16315 [Candidatus Brocadia caroliniensis]